MVLLAIIALGRREGRNQWYFLYFSECVSTHTHNILNNVFVCQVCVSVILLCLVHVANTK